MQQMKGLLEIVQPGPIGGKPGKKAAQAKAPAATKAIDIEKGGPAKGVMTIASLREMLEGLGYEIDTMYSTNERLWVRFDHPNLSTVFSISLSGSKKFIWFLASLTKLDRPNDIPQPALLRLLKESHNQGPAYFKLINDEKYLYLTQSMENREVTPTALRWNVDYFDDAIVNSAPAWNPAVVMPPPAIKDTEATQRDRQRLAGAWKVMSSTQDGKVFDTSGHDITVRFEGTKMISRNGDSVVESSCALSEVGGVKAMDLYGSGSETLAIYKLEGETLTLCMGLKGTRPTKFEAGAGSNNMLVVARRMK
jgi:uncharacterized protein (TIGR03067 family)